VGPPTLPRMVFFPTPVVQDCLMTDIFDLLLSRFSSFLIPCLVFFLLSFSSVVFFFLDLVVVSPSFFILFFFFFSVSLFFFLVHHPMYKFTVHLAGLCFHRVLVSWMMFRFFFFSINYVVGRPGGKIEEGSTHTKPFFFFFLFPRPGGGLVFLFMDYTPTHGGFPLFGDNMHLILFPGFLKLPFRCVLLRVGGGVQEAETTGVISFLFHLLCHPFVFAVCKEPSEPHAFFLHAPPPL